MDRFHSHAPVTGTFRIYEPPSRSIRSATLFLLRLVQAVAAFGLILGTLRRAGVELTDYLPFLADLL